MILDPAFEKKALRRHYRARREAFAREPDAAAVLKALHENLAAFLANAAAFLPPATTFETASYCPIGSEWDFSAHAGAHWLFPRVSAPGELVWCRRGDDLAAFAPSPLGIPEAPAEACAPCDASVTKPWIVLVPALACDHAHVRLGYGGGFYDRLLARHAPHLLSVCCLPSAFRLSRLPHDPWDRAVDVVIDEFGIDVQRV